MEQQQKIKIKEHALWTFNALRKRAKMIHCGDDDYLYCRTFIEGYFFSLQHIIGFEFVKEITNWLAEKYNVSTSTPYILFPEYFHKEKTDAEKKELLLDLMKEYFEKNW